MVADAAHWSSAPWDTMPAQGSACTEMIHWIRQFTLASGMSCIKCEMQSHCFDLLSHGALFVQQCLQVVSGCMLPWGGAPSSDHPITQSVFQKAQWELEETWNQTSTFLQFFSWSSCSASLKSLGVMAYEAMMLIYTFFFLFFLILCELFLRAFEEEKGTGQLNLNGSGMYRGKAERMVVTSDKKWPSFVGKWGQRSPTLLLLPLEHSCEQQLYWYHGNDQNDLGINFHAGMRGRECFVNMRWPTPQWNYSNQFLKNLVIKNIVNKVHKLHLAYLTKKTANFSPLKIVTLVTMEDSKQLAGCWALSVWMPSLGCQLSSKRVENSSWPLQKKVRSTLCFSNFFTPF